MSSARTRGSERMAVQSFLKAKGWSMSKALLLFAELRETFPSADMVDDLTIFNVGGNKYRLIAAIPFNRRRVYVRHVLTHADYDRGEWKP